MHTVPARRVGVCLFALLIVTTTACPGGDSSDKPGAPSTSTGDAGANPADGSAVATADTRAATADTALAVADMRVTDTTVPIPVGDARPSTPDAGTSADAPPPSGTAPMSCQYAEKDNPNKAELSYTVSQASADSNLVSKGYTGEARVLVTYNANGKILTFAFGSPFPAVTPPCLRMSFVIYNAEPPKSGVAYNIQPNQLNPITVAESGACSPLITMWNAWSLAMPATVTFTKIEGANVEMTFSAGMGAKHSNMAAGTFTIAGTIKSPCFMTI